MFSDLRARMIGIQSCLERLEDLTLMVSFIHVDEVNNADATQIAQPQLSGDRHRGLQVGAEYRFLEVAVSDITADINIDGRHCFCLIEYHITAGL